MAVKEGTRVRVWSPDRKEDWGGGTYLGEAPVTVTLGGERVTAPSPTIRLDSGRVVRGYECWWQDVAPPPCPPPDRATLVALGPVREFRFRLRYELDDGSKVSEKDFTLPPDLAAAVTATLPALDTPEGKRAWFEHVRQTFAECEVARFDGRDVPFHFVDDTDP